MSIRKIPKKNTLSAALLAALVLPMSAFAQDTTTDETTDEDVATLEKVVVTGSLIPQSQIETGTPVMIISAEDITARGFTSVADALQKSTFSVGGIQGSQTSASFTQGAETISMFGLPVGFTKFLIDGRPMSNYPALYNGSDAFNNISGIPVDLVERIEILPGGQSSLYGSDAIAGVVNIILKKSMDGSVATMRGGMYQEGGGDSIRYSLATGFSSDDERFNVLIGVQGEKQSPIWAYQRDWTERFKGNLASRDWLVYSPFTSYNWLVPDDACDAVSDGFGGTVDFQTRPGFGDTHYCGSLYSPGYRTLSNGTESYQFYTHATFDISDTASLYGDLLVSSENTSYHVGANYTWWGTSVEWGYFYDPNLDDLLNLQRGFVPEDMGAEGYRNIMNTDKNDAWALTLGIDGVIGEAWDYDLSYTMTRYELDEVGFVRWAEPMNQFFQDLVLGPQLGWDPYYNAYPVFEPNYAAFYQLLTQDQFNAMTGYATSSSETKDDFLRAMVVNSTLWELGGGDAGLAVAAEFGTQDWEYRPHPGYMNGDVWGTTAVAGDGDRNRYSLTGELRTPWTEMLTTTVSARYDAYDFDQLVLEDGEYVDGGSRTLDKFTWSLSAEFRPIDTLLVRGKYGTAFKAPSLPDLYQGDSGYYSFVTDYYQCALAGFPDPVTAPELCPAVHSSRQFFGHQSGSTDLDPINADNWTIGVVFSPFERFNVALDYHDWDIRDQVATQSADLVVLTESNCRRGVPGFDINSPTCQQAISQVIRGSNGRINEIFTPKVNVASETVEALVASLNWGWEWENVGDFDLRTNYTHMIDHTQTPLEGDEPIDLLENPFYGTDPENKADAALTWSRGNWSSTLYANWMDKTPNYASRVSNEQLGWVDSYTRWNASVSWQAMENLEFSFLVNNLLNDMPPEDDSYPGTSGAPYNSAYYDVFGRAYYLEGRFTF